MTSKERTFECRSCTARLPSGLDRRRPFASAGGVTVAHVETQLNPKGHGALRIRRGGEGVKVHGLAPVPVLDPRMPLTPPLTRHRRVRGLKTCGKLRRSRWRSNISRQSARQRRKRRATKPGPAVPAAPQPPGPTGTPSTPLWRRGSPC